MLLIGDFSLELHMTFYFGNSKGDDFSLIFQRGKCGFPVYGIRAQYVITSSRDLIRLELIVVGSPKVPLECLCQHHPSTSPPTMVRPSSQTVHVVGSH